MVLLPCLGVVVCHARAFVISVSGRMILIGARGSYAIFWFKAPWRMDGFVAGFEAVRSRCA
eukprot:4016723-Alexandrium_andersonii.AAC.1